MIKVEFMKPQTRNSKRVVNSTSILGQMQLFPLQKKQHLDSEINMSNLSMKTVCYPGKEHQVTNVKVRLKIPFFDIKT
jgi:septal ring-binding cell division protein DamX